MSILGGFLHIILLAVFVALAVGSYNQARQAGKSKWYAFKHAALWPTRLNRVHSYYTKRN